MWVQSLTLTNIKCFREQQITFSRTGDEGKEGQRCGWITLLGENGVGKSTLLQAIALLLAGPQAAKELLPRPMGWVRNSQEQGKIAITLFQEEGDPGKSRGLNPEKSSEATETEITNTERSGDSTQLGSFTYAFIVAGDSSVVIGEETYTEPAFVEESSEPLKWLRKNAFPSNGKGWFAAGYGAFRRLGRDAKSPSPTKMDKPRRSRNFSTQFDESRPLGIFEEWLVSLDYQLAKDPNNEIAKKRRAMGEKAINKLLPEGSKIAGITNEGVVQFLVNEQTVSTVDLSDGYRSVIALAGDLIWRLIQSFPDLPDPTQACGVVLIDELDIHLHPSWEQQIAKKLRNIFPNIQFIVTTQSHLVASGAGEDALTLKLEIIEGETQVVPITIDISALDADAVLTSEAFGLEFSRSPDAQEKIAHYYELRNRKGELSENEQESYHNLSQWMKEAQPIRVSEPDELDDEIKKFLREKLF